MFFKFPNSGRVSFNKIVFDEKLFGMGIQGANIEVKKQQLREYLSSEKALHIGHHVNDEDSPIDPVSCRRTSSSKHQHAWIQET